MSKKQITAYICDRCSPDCQNAFREFMKGVES